MMSSKTINKLTTLANQLDFPNQSANLTIKKTNRWLMMIDGISLNHGCQASGINAGIHNLPWIFFWGSMICSVAQMPTDVVLWVSIHTWYTFHLLNHLSVLINCGIYNVKWVIHLPFPTFSNRICVMSPTKYTFICTSQTWSCLHASAKWSYKQQANYQGCQQIFRINNKLWFLRFSK